MMRKSIFSCLMCAFVCGCGCLLLLIPNVMGKDTPGEKVSLSIQWLTQCQFGGYYVALDKGFYTEEGIDLTIIPGATDINPIHMVSSDLADFGTKWLADFLASRGNNPGLISIAQILQSNGLIMIAKASSGIKNPRDFMGKQLGIWFFGNETQFFALMSKFDIPLDQLNIDALKWSIKPFLNGRFDVITAMAYNEYFRIIDAGYKKEDLSIIDFSEYGLNFPGQVIFTKDSILIYQRLYFERKARFM
ncbi:ABC transporter substrate-binding protein [Desulfocicer niacini]